MDAYLAQINFPKSADAYEFPDLVLPESNTNAQAVVAARVKRDWLTTGRPDFLTTRLDQSVVELTNFTWDTERKMLTLGDGEPGKAELDLGATGASYTSLVAASGAGKTRFLYEQAYKAFGAYIVAGKSETQPGARDLVGFLSRIPHLTLSGTDADAMSVRLVNIMDRVVLARTAVLRKAKKDFPGLQPRHWLALQLYPDKVLDVSFDVFVDTLVAAEALSFSGGTVQSEWAHSGMRFLCIDEAQIADAINPRSYWNFERTVKRSALACLVKPLRNIGCHVVLAGTGLGIESSWELLASGAAKENVEPRLVGATSIFNVETLRAALQARGVAAAADVDDETLRLYTGRPRFGMRLAAALVLEEDPVTTAESVARDLRKVLSRLKTRPAGSSVNAKTLYGEFRFAAMQWVLKGQGGISRHGEVALEQGVCAIVTTKVSGNTGMFRFTIAEPLMTRAFTDLPEADFEGVTNETDAHLGLMFEDYVAFHAAELCAVLEDRRIIGNKAIKLRAEFQGPWKLADAAGDERRGVRCADNEEPAALREMLERARTQGRGIHLLFPGTAMGADLVVVARRADGRLLLLFVQLKACLKTSTPEAMRSLRLPYRQNRESASPSVPEGSIAAVKALDAEIFRDDVSVVLMVFKYPANSQGGYDRAKEATYAQYVDPPPPKSRARAPRTKTVLELVVDSSNALELLAGLGDGLRAMEGVKQAKASAFVEG